MKMGCVGENVQRLKKLSNMLLFVAWKSFFVSVLLFFGYLPNAKTSPMSNKCVLNNIQFFYCEHFNPFVFHSWAEADRKLLLSWNILYLTTLFL